MGRKDMQRKYSNTEELLDLYKGLVRVRLVEEKLSDLFSEGEIPGFIHLSNGQEAVPVGVMAATNQEDTIASTHRGHGHCIAKGLELEGFFGEVLGKESGLCRGRGGSMHVADFSKGMLGANGIVAAGIPLAMGSALAHNRLGSEAIAIAFFGDGALAEGVLHETLNMSKLLGLPLLFVCENNGWSEFSKYDHQIKFKSKEFVSSYGISYEEVDGNNVLAVKHTAEVVINSVRKNSSPYFLECFTTRQRGHFEGDGQHYRNDQELAECKERDPLVLTELKLTEMGCDAALILSVKEEVGKSIESAVKTARAAPDSNFNAALNGVYSPGETQ